jgi:hypothetical protein
MSTVTSTAVQNWQPKAVHAGLNTVYAKALVTVTAGSIVQMLKIPDGAVIVDGWAQSPADAFKLSVGDGGDPDRFISTAQSSAAVELHRFDEPLGMGYKYSVSDDAIVKYDTIDILVGSASCTGTLELCVTYYMNKDDNQ